MSTEQQQFCTFTLAGGLFGIEVERVQEIIRYQPLTPIPLAPREVAGLINLRGEIVPAIDLRLCVGAAARASDEMPTNVVVRTEDGAVSLFVDEIGDVLYVDEDAYEPPPDNLRGAMRELIRGVYKLESGLLMVLVTEAAIAVSTARLGDDAPPTEPPAARPSSHQTGA
jgi:purine-binding chemotaxis protein CheW